MSVINSELNLISRSFSKYAKEYSANALIQKEIGERLIARLECFTCQPSRILDLGSGVSPFSRLLKKRYPKASVISLDISLSMLLENKQRFRYNPLYLCADGQQLPLKDNSVDFVFSNQVLHWFKTPLRALSEIYRVLKPEGLLLFSTLGPDTFKELVVAFASVDGYRHINPFLDLHDIGDLLMQVGFEAPVMDRDEMEVHYDSLISLSRDLKKQGSVNIHPNRKKSLTTPRQWSDVTKAYQVFINGNGHYPLSYEVLFGQAFKGQYKGKQGASEQTVPFDSLLKSIRSV